MYREPTELLCGCLIGSIWIPTNINLRTYWPKVISHLVSGINLLHVFNISHYSSLCCAQNFSLTSCTKTMAKRMQEQKEEDRIVAKSKPTAMKTTSTVSTSSSSVNHPIASKCLGILKASAKKPDARARINSQPNPASSSQGRVDGCCGGDTCRDR